MKYFKLSFFILFLFTTACGVTNNDDENQTANLHCVIDGTDALTEADHEIYKNGELWGTFEEPFVTDDFPFAGFVEVEAGDVIRFNVAVRNSSDLNTSEITDYEVGFILGGTSNEARSTVSSQGPLNGPSCEGDLEPNTTKQCDIEFEITKAVLQNSQ